MKLLTRPKIEINKSLDIPLKTIESIKRYTENPDRRRLKIRAEKENIDSCLLLFNRTETTDPRNDRTLVKNIIASGFK